MPGGTRSGGDGGADDGAADDDGGDDDGGAAGTKPEYTTFNKGAACEGNGAVSIKTLADCSAAGAALGLSDTPAVDDGQDGVSYDPSYCYFEGGSLKFNSAGTNTGDCTDKDTCVCWVSAPTRASAWARTSAKP